MRDFGKIKYFINCSGKSGTTTLVKGFSNVFGISSTLHVHGPENFKIVNQTDFSLKELMINNSKNFDEIYIIDSYREPFERKISSFFENIQLYDNNWKFNKIQNLIDNFNENYLSIIERYHSYLETWPYFNVSTDIEFDFSNGFILKKNNNINLIKTRLKESYRWDNIFSNILGKNIKFNNENNSSIKNYKEQYSTFKTKYKLPISVKEVFKKFYVTPIENLDTSNEFYIDWVEMNKLMTKDEIYNYLNKWEII